MKPKELFQQLGERLVAALQGDGSADEAEPRDRLLAGLALVTLEHDGCLDTSGVQLDEFAHLRLHPISVAFKFGSGWHVFVQEQVDGVQIDVLLVHPTDPRGRIAVRIADGLADLDRSARYLRRQGWYVLHYSPAVITADAVAVAGEVRKLAGALDEDFLERHDGYSLEDIGGPGSWLGRLSSLDYKVYCEVRGFEQHGDDAVFRGASPKQQPFEALKRLALDLLHPHLRRRPERAS